MRHSGLGLVSCVLLLPTAVPIGLAGVILWWLQDLQNAHHAPGVAEGMALLTLGVLGLGGLAGLCSSLGLCLGLVGLRSQDRRRVTAGVGAGMHALLLVGLAVAAILTFGPE